MLGKRQRSMLMRRTTSLASMPSVPKQVRQGSGGGGGDDDDKDRQARARPSSSVSAGAVGTGGGAGGGYPSPGRDAFAGLMITAAFLSACGFCAKPLGPGEDTYIYRGEVAFCSQECREHQIAKDELMEQNCTITSIREAPSDQSGSGGGSGGAGDAVATA
ncbi:hypothetical protein CFC21_084433 [Triticum aestivum]|uniref:FLZ-type domain-containing protein n=3 Tax=Triticum aestivum TaxID=4565 RepID=A0A9R1I9Y0_WHEAT|nr:FCS-Like Zinc finger 7-like [Triticum dicoccoides]KAF7080337.1 hypothetical protein CFC21_084433 [Triticum aestivum]